MRGAELAENAAVSRLLRALEPGGRLHRLEPAPLDFDATAALVRSIDARLDIAPVYAESEGNPLFALEIARAAAEGSAAPAATLDRRIEERLERLDAGARRLLPWVIALGRRLDVALLERATRLSAAELLVGLQELERRGILRAAGPDRYDFGHDLVRRSAYRRLSEPARRLIHLEIACALDRGQDPDDALAGEVARHAELGGDAALAAHAARDRAPRLRPLAGPRIGAERRGRAPRDRDRVTDPCLTPDPVRS